MRILLVELDGTSKENENIQKGLKRYGFTVDREAYRSTLSSFIQTEAFEVILLDLNLSKVSGLSVLRKIRAEGIKIPIIILTSSKSLKDKVKTFDSGADDYLIKPIDLDELSARICALQRRYINRVSPLLTHQDIELNPSTFSVTLKGKDISFSRREFSLLQKLLENKGRVVSRTSLNLCLYGWADEIDSNTLEVHVHNIRKKLKNTQLIQTIRGIGYSVGKENV